jgi:hypothetical protein
LLLGDSDVLFDRLNWAVGNLDVGAKVGANMRRGQAALGDVWRTLLQVDGTQADAELRSATGLG